MIKPKLKHDEKSNAKYLSVRTAAETIGADISFIYRRIAAGQIKAFRLSPRKIAIPKSSLEKFIESREIIPKNYPKDLH